MDNINHPKHYCFSRIEPIEVIEDWNLPFHLGNVVKYIARWDKKEDKTENLKKARWYLDRFIELISKNTAKQKYTFELSNAQERRLEMKTKEFENDKEALKEAKKIEEKENVKVEVRKEGKIIYN